MPSNDNSFRLPKKVLRGNPVRAEDHNKIIHALEILSSEVRARTICPSVSIGTRRTPGGTTLFAKTSGKGGKPVYPPLWPVLTKKDDAWVVTVVSHGHVIEKIHTLKKIIKDDGKLVEDLICDEDDPLIFHKVGGIKEENEPVEYAIDIDQALYVLVETDCYGVIDSGSGPSEEEDSGDLGPCHLVVEEKDMDHVPPKAPDPEIEDDEGTPGKFYFRLATVIEQEVEEGEEEPDEPVLVLDPILAGSHINFVSFKPETASESSSSSSSSDEKGSSSSSSSSISSESESSSSSSSSSSSDSSNSSGSSGSSGSSQSSSGSSDDSSGGSSGGSSDSSDGSQPGGSDSSSSSGGSSEHSGPPGESSDPSDPSTPGSNPSDPSDPSDGSDPSDNPGGGSESEGPKSTAIVPASWDPQGYTALFVAEMPEVRFDDLVRVKVTGPVTRQQIDPKFVEVCVAGSIEICGLGPNKAVSVGAEIERGDDGLIYVKLLSSKLPWRRADGVVVRITGVRKGFQGVRFPSRSARQFHANERHIKSAYPGS